MKRLSKMMVGVVMTTAMVMGSMTVAFAEESLCQQVLVQNQQKLANQRMDAAAMQCYLVTECDTEKTWTAKDPITGRWLGYTLDGYTDKEDKIKNLSLEIIKNIDTEYEKCKAIHDWVSKNIWYDWDTYESEKNIGNFPVDFDTSPVHVLETKKTVCDGYANLTVALLREAGIPAKKIDGYALGAGTDGKWTESILSGEGKQKINHAWTAAFVDGRWLLMDTTWDSQNTYRNGRFGTQQRISDEYFDMTAEKLSQKHKIISAESNIPTEALFNLTEEERLALWAERDRTEYPDTGLISVGGLTIEW